MTASRTTRSAAPAWTRTPPTPIGTASPDGKEVVDGHRSARAPTPTATASTTGGRDRRQARSHQGRHRRRRADRRRGGRDRHRSDLEGLRRLHTVGDGLTDARGAQPRHRPEQLRLRRRRQPGRLRGRQGRRPHRRRARPASRRASRPSSSTTRSASSSPPGRSAKVVSKGTQKLALEAKAAYIGVARGEDAQGGRRGAAQAPGALPRALRAAKAPDAPPSGGGDASPPPGGGPKKPPPDASTSGRSSRPTAATRSSARSRRTSTGSMTAGGTSARPRAALPAADRLPARPGRAQPQDGRPAAQVRGQGPPRPHPDSSAPATSGSMAIPPLRCWTSACLPGHGQDASVQKLVGIGRTNKRPSEDHGIPPMTEVVAQICFVEDAIDGAPMARIVSDHELGFTPTTLACDRFRDLRYGPKALERLASTAEVRLRRAPRLRRSRVLGQPDGRSHAAGDLAAGDGERPAGGDRGRSRAAPGLQRRLSRRRHRRPVAVRDGGRQLRERRSRPCSPGQARGRPAPVGDGVDRRLRALGPERRARRHLAVGGRDDLVRHGRVQAARPRAPALAAGRRGDRARRRRDPGASCSRSTGSRRTWPRCASASARSGTGWGSPTWTSAAREIDSAARPIRRSRSRPVRFEHGGVRRITEWLDDAGRPRGQG